MGNGCTVDSDSSEENAIKWIKELRKKYGRVKIDFTTGKSNSWDQKALFHVWLREYYRQKYNKNPSTDEEKKFKWEVKIYAYTQGLHFMSESSYSSFLNKEMPRLVSVAKLSTGEMYQLMNFTQMIAAQEGIILEAKGEYKKLKESQHEV